MKLFHECPKHLQERPKYLLQAPKMLVLSWLMCIWWTPHNSTKITNADIKYAYDIYFHKLLFFIQRTKHEHRNYYSSNNMAIIYSTDCLLITYPIDCLLTYLLCVIPSVDIRTMDKCLVSKERVGDYFYSFYSSVW